MKKFIYILGVTSLVLHGCATVNVPTDDDAYYVKPSQLGVGESTADETSYAAYKARKEKKNTSLAAYSDELAMQQRSNCLNQWQWYEGCGCSYDEWLRFSRFSPMGGTNSAIYMNGASAFNNYNSFYYRPNYWNSFIVGAGMGYPGYYGYDPYTNFWGSMYGHGSSFGYPYNYYGSSFGYPYNYYGSSFGYPFGYYGYFNGGYGYGGNMNGWYGGNSFGNSSSNNNASSNTVIRKARGTVSGGYSNPTNRQDVVNKVKLSNAPVPTVGNDKGTPVSAGRPLVLERKQLDKSVGVQTSETRTVSPSRVSAVSSNRLNMETREASPSRTVNYRENTNLQPIESTRPVDRTVPSRFGTSTTERTTTPTRSFESTRSYEPSNRSISTPSQSSPSQSRPSSPSNSGSSRGGTVSSPNRR
jgi:hypothetical protein